MQYFVVTLLIANGLFAHSFEFDPNTIPHINSGKLKTMISSGHQQLLVFFYTDYKQCVECELLMPKFHEAVDYVNKLNEGEVSSYKLAAKFPEYGVNKLPQLLFFASDASFVYFSEPGEDYWNPADILEWMEEAKQTPVQQLTDETFEHLTQASTGATTGDWLILFADHTRPECMKPLLPTIGTIASKLRMRKNVGLMDTSKNFQTFTRFKDILNNSCASMLFFHRTELYAIPADDYSVAFLLKFVLDDYQNANHYNVPSSQPDIDMTFEEVLDGLRSLLHRFFFMHIGFTVLMVLILSYLLLSLISRVQKKKLI